MPLVGPDQSTPVGPHQVDKATIAIVPGTDPDRASYRTAVDSAPATVTEARSVITSTADLAGAIGHAVLAT
jgi:hypothetical protein